MSSRQRPVRGSDAASARAVATSIARDRDIRLASILLPCANFVVLCYEIALTRVFAYVFPYQLTVLAVSFAVCCASRAARWSTPRGARCLSSRDRANRAGNQIGRAHV